MSYHIVLYRSKVSVCFDSLHILMWHYAELYLVVLSCIMFVLFGDILMHHISYVALLKVCYAISSYVTECHSIV